MVTALKFIAFLSFVYLYQEGGQGHRWAKKWVGPGVLAAFLLIILALHKKLGIITGLGALLYIGAANGFAYGEKFTHNKTWLKVLFRGLVGASYGLCGLLIIANILQLFLATLGSIIFGVLNPFPSKWGDWATRAEDICIAISYIALVILLT